MRSSVRIGIIGDFNPQFRSHAATDAALAHAADALAVAADVRWLPTPSLRGAHAQTMAEPYDGLWASPGSPYRSMEGALDAIRFAREHDRPFIGT